MKTILKYAWTILFAIVFIAVVITNMYLKFSNVDFTSTRLFVTYWPVYLIELPVILFFYFMCRRELEK